MTSASPTPRGVYLITPDEPDTARLLARTAPLLAAGATWLQYRNKTASDALRREQATALQALCAAHGVPLIVNDDPALAHAIGAAGVHLGGTDGDIGAARSLLGPDAIIGASCYDQLANAERAVAAGASYVAFGAFFPTTTKVTSSRAHVDLLRQSAALGVPRVAIGGLSPDNVGPIIDAGADLLAVVSGIYAAQDPVATQRAYLARFDTQQ
ncbi:thiamine phosphate synthase [Stenotrophomonas lactitubi]|jgi:thiamine-phosphate pyrophosphorylase|uniref:thiamine phosphate synthase n=1 Tax=Stenotrophomonas lactitubi TaxID=2045214 RepID=UPI001D1D213E|nr:thiamine phosphate synthase [Stenotrophomonas lactitubi]CAH0218705.1 Thiamine-phosphate synthase [Stenotrophomonas lactitubi]CAH0232296.1 Thiamine-phosphate synthase [Stenotrophomonas lactitubi]CAH0240419.1 Thiamine-phosphate synthase [Stenotrophomonas lactitubi]CAH0261140.1 Thiamine-phosphate synthase [Stenotrophomonas lactitubi]